MHQIKGKILEGGRIIVPASFRKALQIEPGDTVILEHDGEQMTVRPAKSALSRLQAKMRGLTVSPPQADADEADSAIEERVGG